MPDKINEIADRILAGEGRLSGLALRELLHELHRDIREKCAVAVEESEGTVVGHGSEMGDLQSEVLRVAAGRVRQVK
jgi:hypothetical protein